MSALYKQNKAAVDRFNELCPEFQACMIPHLTEGWVLAVMVEDACHFVHAGQVQTELEALADVEPHYRGGYILGSWDGAADLRAPLEVDLDADEPDMIARLRAQLSKP